VWSHDPLQYGDAEGERLAGSGARLADEIRAHKCNGQRHLLDREGCHDARLLESIGNFSGHAKVVERTQKFLVSFVCCRKRADNEAASGRNRGCYTAAP
jgi:hypothetical protein